MATRLKSSSVRAVQDIPLAACLGLRRRLQFDDVHIERQRKLSFWSKVNGVENVVATYDSVSRTKEFTLVTYHYDVVIGQSAPNDTNNNNISNIVTNSFINTV